MRTGLALTAMLAAALAAGAETLDRIAVTVGKEVITESALVLDLRVTAFLDREPVEITPAAKRRAADRLVDQILILKEAKESHLPLPTNEEAQVLVDQIKQQYATPDEFDAELERHDITEKDLLAHMLAGLQASVFTDLRFRPGVYVSEDDARAYYDQLAKKETGTGLPSFEASRPEIVKLLTEERVLKALDAWLGMARMDVRIEYREKVFQ